MASRLDALIVETGDGVEFTLPLAGVMTRFLAWFLDLFVIGAISTAGTQLVGLFSVFSSDAAQAFRIVLFFAVSTGYAFTCEWRLRGQTIGKRLFGIRVVDAEGMKLKVSQLILRNLLRMADMLPLAYVVGGAAMLLSKKAQRLGDFAAGTVVVRVVNWELPALAGLLGDEYNTLAEHAVVVARLRREVEPSAAQAALGALMRREHLDAEHRVLLFGEFARHFKSLVRFPEHALTGMSDERFVQNVVRLLFQKEKLKVPAART
ncbi:MAG: RDD family protein [Polyangiaceae bacterium]|nr:RDD family protein [Polyangiaceae bacterium]